MPARGKERIQKPLRSRPTDRIQHQPQEQILVLKKETVAPTEDDPQSETEIDNVKGSDAEHGTVEQEQGEDTLSVLEDLHHFADQAMECDAGDFNAEEDKLLQDDVE